jgi:hypothetical protein
MKKMKTKVMLIAAILTLTTGSTLADWPQYLGPDIQISTNAFAAR